MKLVNATEEVSQLLDALEESRAKVEQLTTALESISGLWPEPPHCADVYLDWIGPNDGKMRAGLLQAALQIARQALGREAEAKATK
jgi:hypothetical protein